MSHSRSHNMPCSTFGCGLLLVLTLGVGSTQAASYVGLGGGVTPHLGTRIITHYETGPESLSVKTGYGFEAQFGWEGVPWIDIEGALRYHLFTCGDSAVYTRATPIEHELVGFEGGIRVHPRRGVSNSMPYVRLGLGSYSPSIKLSDGETISGDPVLGYFVGLGYVYEVSGFWGVDVRATAVVYNAFNPEESRVRLKAALISLSTAVIIF